jgi:hypothetical protein
MGTEIRTFTSLKDLSEFLVDETSQQKALFEDYSQWLGSLLRTCEGEHKNEDWYQKSAALQKTLKGSAKKAPEPKANAKKGGKNAESSCWIQSGTVMLSSTAQGPVEILFEAIEKINGKIQDLDKFKAAVQQLERLGLGKSISYVVYIEDEIPKKVVLRAKSALPSEESFKFSTELSVPSIYADFIAK